MIILPFPPTVNHYYRNVQGRTLISHKGRAYRSAVAQALMVGRVRGVGRRALTLSIDAYMPDSRRRDLDNLLKAVLDGLQHGGLMADDSQVTDLRIRRAGIDRDHPRIEVTAGTP